MRLHGRSLRRYETVRTPQSDGPGGPRPGGVFVADLGRAELGGVVRSHGTLADDIQRSIWCCTWTNTLVFPEFSSLTNSAVPIRRGPASRWRPGWPRRSPGAPCAK